MHEHARRRALSLSAGDVTCLLDGQRLAARLEARLAPRARRFAAAQGRLPTLVSVLHGGHAASLRQAALKAAAAERTGMRVVVEPLPPATDTAGARAVLGRLAGAADVDGILLQYPLPPAVDEHAAAAMLPASKDLDVSGPDALARFETGGPAPAAAAAMMSLCRHHGLRVSGMAAVVVGRGTWHDRPFAERLARAGARVERVRPEDPALPERLAWARLVVVALGAPGAIPGDALAPGAVVVDAGYFNAGGKGDVDLAGAPPLRALAPVPGGIGPVTVAVLLARTLRAAERRVP